MVDGKAARGGESPILAAALEYAARGWITGPVWRILEDGRCACRQGGCKAAGKHPFKGGRGSNDPAVVRRHFADCDAGGVYIQLGKASGVIALDVDPRNGGDVTLDRLELDVEILPSTLTAFTGGGGQHRLFRYVEVPAGDIHDCPGIDVQSNGKIIVAAPSPHRSGRPYRWLNEAAELAQLPEAWVALLRRQHAARRAAEQSASTATATAVGPVAVPDAIAGGGRNATLTRIAGRLRARGAERDAIAAELQRINAERCKPPLPDAEVGAIARSVARYAPGIAADPASVEQVRELAALVAAQPWLKIAGATQREALLCILALAEGLGRLTIGLSWRQLGELANIGDTASKRALAALQAGGWLQLAEQAAGRRAATYTVARPGVLQDDPTLPVGGAVPPPRCGAELQHDAFRWGGGCGKNARPLLEVLDATPRQAAELARRAGLRRDTAHRLLHGKLQATALAVQQGTGWVRGPATLDDAAKRLCTASGRPIAGRRLALIARHQQEREAWRRERMLREAVQRVPDATPAERAALLRLVRRHAGFATGEAEAAAHAVRMLAQVRAEAVRVDAPPRRLTLTAPDAPTPPAATVPRWRPPRRRLPDNCTTWDKLAWREIWLRDDYTQRWGDAQWLRDPAARAAAKADVARLRRELAEAERDREAFLARQRGAA